MPRLACVLGRPGCVVGCLGDIFARAGGVLGRFGSLWGGLGPLGAVVGPFQGRPGAVWGRSGLPRGRSRAVLGTVLGAFAIVFGGHCGMSLEPFWVVRVIVGRLETVRWGRFGGHFGPYFECPLGHSGGVCFFDGLDKVTLERCWNRMATLMFCFLFLISFHSFSVMSSMDECVATHMHRTPMIKLSTSVSVTLLHPGLA